MKRLLAPCLFIAAFVFACQATEDQQPEFDSMTRTSPIFYGTPDTSQAHQAVVYLDSNVGACTGTLISPRVVLTAAHCVYGATYVTAYFGNDVDSLDDSRNIVEVSIHPNYSDSDLDADIALVRLSHDAPSSVSPIPHLPSSLAISSSDEDSLDLEFVGFGYDENWEIGEKQKVTQTLEHQCSSSSGCSIWDSPWSIPAGTLSYTQSGGGPCSGDSGGPAFIFRNGTEYVAGVTSYGDEPCTDYGVSTKVDYYESFINEFLAVDLPNACDAPALMHCGDSISGTTSGAASVFSSYSCISDWTEDGPEVAYELAIEEETDVSITLEVGSNSDLDILILDGSCDTDSCVGGSAEEAGTDELVDFTAASGSYFLMVETYDGAGPFTLTVTCNEICGNGYDDDRDGATDCDDSECASLSSCQTPEDENCTNGADDDGDGDADCDDSDCYSHSSCVEPDDENCTNGVDDDGDGDIDCYDSDCADLLACTPEDCGNDSDDDGDGAIDCDDLDCNDDPSCEGLTENCTNGIDDDGDGDADCDDALCAGSEYCVDFEICDNAIDDDGDSLVDCDDADCNAHIACESEETELCDNELDDDGDNLIDCDDSDCNSFGACLSDEICGNSLDDDGDGAVDCDDSDCNCEENVEEDDGISIGTENCSVSSRRRSAQLPASAWLLLGALGLLAIVRKRSH